MESAMRRCPIKYILEDQSALLLHRRVPRLLFPSTTVTSSIVLTSVFVLGKSASAAKLRRRGGHIERQAHIYSTWMDMVVDMHLIIRSIVKSLFRSFEARFSGTWAVLYVAWE